MSAPYQLRDYQQQAVDAVLQHFRKSDDTAVVVLPTGAGKSLVIAELARLARNRILILTHVKELVAQNHEKFSALGINAGVYSAGLNQKASNQRITFASVQSAAKDLDAFRQDYSLVIIDECHRLSPKKDDNQYHQLIGNIKAVNSRVKILGLTATPYRLDSGWIYQFHHRGFTRETINPPFKTCIYELPLRTLVKRGFLTPPSVIDAPVAEYDFSALESDAFNFEQSMSRLLVKHKRVTQSIVEQIYKLAESRNAVMIFAASVQHAEEIMSYLPRNMTRMITGMTPNQERDALIEDFKQQKYKFLVNISVLTTGFDAPHVDVIAILRRTESVSLFQQIVGRGLRLFPGKKDCLVIDYAGNNMDLYAPEIGKKKPNERSQPVQVDCPLCGFSNTFWGIKDDMGHIIEHYGRRCQGLKDDETPEQCDYRFKFKTCPECNAENDIAARRCQQCDHTLIDPDDQLKKALQLSDALVIRCSGMAFNAEQTKLVITYHDEQGEEVKERFDFSKPLQVKKFNDIFSPRLKSNMALLDVPEVIELEQALTLAPAYPAPDFVVAKKRKLPNKRQYWRVGTRIFDYHGAYRKANALS